MVWSFLTPFCRERLGDFEGLIFILAHITSSSHLFKSLVVHGVYRMTVTSSTVGLTTVNFIPPTVRHARVRMILKAATVRWGRCSTPWRFLLPIAAVVKSWRTWSCWKPFPFFVLQQLPGISEGVLKLDLSFSCLLLPWWQQSALGMHDTFCLTLSHRAFRWFALLLPPFLSSWGGALFDGKCVLGLFSNIGSPLALGPACLTYHCSVRLLLTFLITLRSPLVDS